MASSGNVIDLIIAEHREAEADYKRYEAATDKEEKQRIAFKLMKDLDQHAAQEEMSVYPWMKEHDKSTAHEVDHGIHEHGKVKDDLYKLDSMKADDPEFPMVMAKVWKDLEHHMKSEEKNILPKLKDIATEQQLQELGKKFLDAKKIAPTRPHPSGPTAGGVGTKIVNAAASVIDAARDKVQGRP